MTFKNNDAAKALNAEKNICSNEAMKNFMVMKY
jgi:hypothetical protein